MLKFWCQTPIGYEPRKWTQAVQGCLLGGHKSTPAKHRHLLFPPSTQLPPPPLITEDLPGSWPGRYTWVQTAPNNIVSPVPQSVLYHVIICFCLPACYNLLPARPGYMACWVKSLCICWSLVGCVCTHRQNKRSNLGLCYSEHTVMLYSSAQLP